MPAISTFSLAVSVLAFAVAARNYRRKSGVAVYGSYQTVSDYRCTDSYVSSVNLENQKDRAVTIFAIYLKLGHNNFIELEEFNPPLILKAYESVSRVYEPVEFHAASAARVSLRNALQNRRLTKRLILSTSVGRYQVRYKIRRWSPVELFFSNHLTNIIRPIRTVYKGKGVGGKVRFVLELREATGREDILQLTETDYQLMIFKDFQLTRDSLSSKANLERFLAEQKNLGKLHSADFTVYDVPEWRAEVHTDYTQDVRELPTYSAFDYFVRGRLLTRKRDAQLRQENQEARERAHQNIKQSKSS